MADLGDLSDFLKEGAIPTSKEGSVNDVSWLAVDDAEYRAQDVLPKQNLNIAPDLEAMWAHEDRPATDYLPKDHRPATMGDLSQAHGPISSTSEDIIRTARLALMQSPDPARLRDALVKRFDLDSLRAARPVLASLIAERGLLGKLYIDASDFSGCHNSPKQAVNFVRKFANDARFVVAKPECHGCTHALQGPVGGTNCAVFHKQLVVEVPYSEALAEEVERVQSSKGKAVQASNAPPKERVRLALLAEGASYGSEASTPKPVVNPAQYMKPTVAAAPVVLPPDLTGQKKTAHAAVDDALRSGRLSVPDAKVAFRTIAATQDADVLAQVVAAVTAAVASPRNAYVGAGTQAPIAPVSPQTVSNQLIAAESLTRKRDEAAKYAMSAHKAAPVVALLRREMLKGRSEVELGQALKYAFSLTDLHETRPHWEPIFREAGLYGSIYTTQDSFADCREGSDFIAKHNPGIRAVVAGEKCSGCVYNKIGRCLLYGKPLAKQATEVVTWETADAVLQDHRIAGRADQTLRNASVLGSTPEDALKTMYRGASLQPTPAQAGIRMETVQAFRGNSPQHVTAGLVKREIVKTASKYMNEGLYGNDLAHALRRSYDERDLVAANEDLREVLAEQGLQGIYFVDPTVYDDYGKGCEEPARLFRARVIQYVKAGSKCGSCVHQTRPGFCSKLHKALVEEPPYVDKAAQQAAILNSGSATEVSYESLMAGGMGMLAEYQMQNGGMVVEVDAPKQQDPIIVSFDDNQAVKG
jgi:hypothetical protein